MKITGISMVCVLFLFACSKNTSNAVNINYDRLEFGSFYNFCIGDECYTTYIVADNKVLKQTSSPQKQKTITTEMPLAKMDSALRLTHNIPDYLLQNPKKTFGCPDCADQGGIFVRIIKNRDTLSWVFDNYDMYNPQEVKDYTTLLKSTIEYMRK